MKEQVEDRRSKQQMRNMQFSEDRFQLFDTIRTIVNDELDRRGVVKQEGNPHPENPPPEGTGREPPDRKPPRRSLWQRLMGIFTSGLL